MLKLLAVLAGSLLANPDAGGTAPEATPPATQGPSAAEPATQGPSAADPAQPATPLSPAVRVVCSGRVGAGLLVDGGRAAVVLLELVRVGWPARVETSDGRVTWARIEAVDPGTGLARLALDEPATAGTPTFRAAAVGEAVRPIGHGGSVGLATDSPLREQLTFSALPTVVLSVGDGAWVGLVLDRAPGDGDAGAPLVAQDGAIVGLWTEPVLGGAGRGRGVGGDAVAAMASAPVSDRPWPRRSHFATWGGLGAATHNQPFHLAGTVVWGARIVVLDVLRIEPFVEGLVGSRGAGGGRPADLWWAVEGGLSLGARIPLLRTEGSRDYVVPTGGFRIGGHRFDHRVTTLVADCPQDDCAWSLERRLDREAELRAGIDLGLDIRHGGMRIGYRAFLDPTALKEHLIHRIFVTWDDLPLPLHLGDSR